MNYKTMLPKLLIQRVPSMWDKTIPTDIPRSSSEFSMKFENEEITSVVKDMEANLNTEESIIKEYMIPENNVLGTYLGTYDVYGTAGELTLLSPNKVNESSVGVIALHYNEESKEWENIEDAQIIDGYVWGTLQEFSPIAVFTIKRDSFFLPTGSYEARPKYNVFVANGLSVIISKNEDGETIVTDGNGKVTVLEDPENTHIIGGTIDGSIVDNTSVTLKGAKVRSILGGSEYCTKEEAGPTTNKLIKVTVIDGAEAMLISAGPGCNCRADKAILNVKDSKLQFIAAGESYCAALNTNYNPEGCDYNLGLKSWLKDLESNIDNTEVEWLYSSGNAGYTYTLNAKTTVKNTTVTGNAVCGGSNGCIDNISINFDNCILKSITGNNRGITKNSAVCLKNCEITKGLIVLSGDTGSIENISIDISGSSIIPLNVGKLDGAVVTDPEVVKGIVNKIKISRSSKYSFVDDNAKLCLNNLIVIK